MPALVERRIKLILCVAAVSAAYVDILRSLAEGIWHAPLYWLAVSSVIPAGIGALVAIYRSQPALHQEAPQQGKRAPSIKEAATTEPQPKPALA